MAFNEPQSDWGSVLSEVGRESRVRMKNCTVRVYSWKTWCYRYTPAEEEVEHESALPHQRVNKYDLFCVGSDSRASAEEQLHILKMLHWRTCVRTVCTAEIKRYFALYLWISSVWEEAYDTCIMYMTHTLSGWGGPEAGEASAGSSGSMKCAH